jgi:hypothetical protein
MRMRSRIASMSATSQEWPIREASPFYNGKIYLLHSIGNKRVSFAQNKVDVVEKMKWLRE